MDTEDLEKAVKTLANDVDKRVQSKLKRTGARRRINGEGTIIKRANGTYEARITLSYKDGKQISKSLYARTKEEAVEKLHKAIEERNNHQDLPLPTGMPTLGEWFEIWLHDYKKDLSGSAKYQYGNCIKKMKSSPILSTKLNELKPIDLQHYINAITSSYLANTSIALLKGALQCAVDNYYLERSPATALKNTAPPPTQKKSVKFYTLEEESAFFQEADKSPYKLAYYLARYAGLRQGEVLALTWNNIDLEKKRLSITQGACLNEKGESIVSKPKTQSSIRSIPISAVLFQALSSAPSREGYVCTGNNHRIRYQTLNVDMRSINARIGQSHTMHHLRHTFATRNRENGVPLHLISAFMGHESVKITDEVYTHASEEAITANYDKLK